MRNEASTQDEFSSRLAVRLLSAWSWGFLSANTAQWLVGDSGVSNSWVCASAAWGTWQKTHELEAPLDGAALDGLQQSDIQRLATRGSHGAYSGNVRRDLERQFFNNVSAPRPMAIDAPTKGSATKIEDLPTSLLSPLDVC
eukprot:6212958-Pyramimonas_sp.AAC.1